MPSVIGKYAPRSANVVPEGFAKVCIQQRWDVQGTWQRLCDFRKPWFEAENGAYIYFNKGDGQWWVDEADGTGVYVSRRDTPLPPADGWEPLGSSPMPVPNVLLCSE